MKRIMIAGTNSGCGKTTVACALISALVQRNIKTASFKCGPDYIDPMFHKKITGIPAYNLDSFFCEKNTLLHLLEQGSRGSEISIIEGVMGFYDGENVSSHSISEITDTSVIIVLDCRGMSDSIGAVMSGFMNYRKNKIAGFIFNRLPEKLVPSAKKLCTELGAGYFGYFPKNDISFSNRHLGLVTADEINDLQDKMKRLGEIAEKNILIDKILDISENSIPKYSFSPVRSYERHPKIAAARDKAFCFCYDENIDLLREMGCEILFFSPLYDKKIPDADGLILCGGYPELYARELSENTDMLGCIENAVRSGIPYIAECGGFMYLHDIIEDKDGNKFRSAGIFKGSSYYVGKLLHFGYVSVVPKYDCLISEKDGIVRAHEFHYWESTCGGQDCTAEKNDGRSWECCHCGENYYAGFPHLYFYSNIKTAERFVKKCTEFGGYGVGKNK